MEISRLSLRAHSCPQIFVSLATPRVSIQNKMAEDNTEEAETNQSTLALDSNKQREFEDKVKRIRAEVTV